MLTEVPCGGGVSPVVFNTALTSPTNASMPSHSVVISQLRETDPCKACLPSD